VVEANSIAKSKNNEMIPAVVMVLFLMVLFLVVSVFNSLSRKLL
jgi:hypothetical protein